MPLDRECVIDGCRLWLEGDMLCLQPQGTLTAQVVDWVQSSSQYILSRHPHYYILGDLRDAGAIPAALRRRLAEYGAQHPPRAMAFYHVGLLVQGINALLFGALNILSKRKQSIRQCSSEAEARAWLQTQRLAAAGPPAP